MKQIMLTFFLLASLAGYSQMDFCMNSNFKYSDPENNFSICIPKHYKVSHSKTGVVFVDTANASNEIIIQSITNANHSTMSNWTEAVRKNLGGGITGPEIKITDHIVSNNSGVPTQGQKLLAKYTDGSESTVIFVPLKKDNSKVLMVIYVAAPTSKSVRDIIFSAELMLMMISMKMLS